MPSARLLALAPTPGQQLLLRSATATAAASTSSSSSSSGGGGGSSVSMSDSRAGLAPPRTRPRMYLSQHTNTRPSSSSLSYLGWCRCASTLASSSTATATATANYRRHTHAAASRVASFSTATLPKQVAFPRHGKAVEPQHLMPPKPGKRQPRKTPRRSSKTGAAVKAKEDGVAAAEAAAAAEASATTAGAASTGTGSAEEVAAEEDVEEEEEEEEEEAEEGDLETGDAGEAATAAEAAGDTAAETAAASRPAAPIGRPSVAIDAHKLNLGRDIDAGGIAATTSPASSITYPENIVELAADAAAAADAAVVAAENASVAAGIVNDSLVIELGPPKPAMGAISGPSETDTAAASATTSLSGPQQQQQQQQKKERERFTLPASLRQPLSQRMSLPHLVPPPYVHHFDSYSLVKQLMAGGYTQAQAITAMKGVRLLLAQNLEVAQSNLVSKSDVENEAYLFKAACAELSIEVRNNRRRADEQSRQQRTLLQSEVDIAAQSVNQELVTLTDVVKGLFNDRKMAVREEQKALESAVQQLNYKITIMLNSEMRSEIEALRWVLIRRSVLGIIFMVILILGSLRYASYLSHEKQKQAERAAREAREAETLWYTDTKIDSSSPPDAAEILAAN